MANGYRPPAGDGIGPLIRELDDIRRQLRELQIPTGTAMNSLVAQVQATLANIDATVASAISTLSYTKSQIDALVASPGAIAPTTVTASGAVTGATGVFNGGLKSTDVYSHLVTYGGSYSATWTHVDGTIGTAPSSMRFKQDVVPADVDVAALERAEVVHYRYRAAVENLGDDAEVNLGGIAEQFLEVGMGHTVTLDPDGEPFSIEDRPLLYTLLAGYQKLAQRVAELEADKVTP